jgi:hypothetical protein
VASFEVDHSGSIREGGNSVEKKTSGSGKHERLERGRPIRTSGPSLGVRRLSVNKASSSRSKRRFRAASSARAHEFFWPWRKGSDRIAAATRF